MTDSTKNIQIQKTLWIDNDACPKRIREVIYKAAIRKNIPVKIVANSYTHPPRGVNAEVICVNDAFDAADDHIVEMVKADDLVITADIPLADRVITKGAVALSPHGEIYNKANIQERLAMRNLRQELRSAGEIRGGKGAFSDKDVNRFAKEFDRLMAKF
jgi:uncharacterized protein